MNSVSLITLLNSRHFFLCMTTSITYLCLLFPSPNILTIIGCHSHSIGLVWYHAAWFSVSLLILLISHLFWKQWHLYNRPLSLPNNILVSYARRILTLYYVMLYVSALPGLLVFYNISIQWRISGSARVPSRNIPRQRNGDCAIWTNEKKKRRVPEIPQLLLHLYNYRTVKTKLYTNKLWIIAKLIHFRYFYLSCCPFYYTLGVL